MEEEIAMPIMIMIVKDHRGCSIVPPHTPARIGDVVRFSAIKTAVQINFPGPPLFTNSPNQFPVGANQFVEVELRKDPEIIGPHPFSAFCEECNMFAEGGSSGDLIVGP